MGGVIFLNLNNNSKLSNAMIERICNINIFIYKHNELYFYEKIICLQTGVLLETSIVFYKKK